MRDLESCNILHGDFILVIQPFFEVLYILINGILGCLVVGLFVKNPTKIRPAHTFPRDNWYLELIQDQLMASANNGRFSYYADGKISFALKHEYAEAGARVITGEGYPEVVTLTGNPVTQPRCSTSICT